MLIDIPRVVVASREILLQVMFNVMLDTETVNYFQNPVCVTFPVGRAGHGQIISPTDFVKVNKFMGAAFSSAGTARER